VGIGPASLTAVFCEAAADRNARTREDQPAPFDRPESAISDGARGIAKAVSRLARARLDGPERGFGNLGGLRDRIPRFL
jgi:hypothetical protein